MIKYLCFAEENGNRNEKGLAMKHKKTKAGKTASRVIDRIFGIILATVIVVGICGLGLEWVLVKGPSPALKESFVMTMFWTRRFDFIPRIFLTEDEVESIIKSRFTNRQYEAATDVSLISINTEETDPNLGPQPDAYGIIDEDGDGIIIQDVKKKGFVGKMIIVKDPSRVFVGMPEFYGGYGMTLQDMAARYGALGGINGGAFIDEDGGGTGGYPDGLVVVNGQCYSGGTERTFVGFDTDNILHIGVFDEEEAHELRLRDGVSFGPALIVNGEGIYGGFMESGINPRSAIGQRADGAVLLLCIDGRQMHSIGCSFGDVRDVMIDYGAMNACNLDGGSSTVMYYNGEIINSPSSASGTSRALPNAFLFK